MKRETLVRALLAASAAAMLVSILFPYWKLKVVAPQYPKGLSVSIYLNKVTGDVQEIDTLNHYIGMRPLKDAGKLERSLAIPGVAFMVICLGVAFFWTSRLSFFLILPAILFPAIFAADLFYWLQDFGLHLNPHAPLSSSVKPFVPPLLGQGKIAQFQAHADFAFGHGLSMLTMILSVVASILRLKKTSSKALNVFILLCLLSTLSSSRAYAETLTVGQGSYTSIQLAVDAAKEGDTILVKKGIYSESLVVKKSLTLIGENLPVIDGGGKGTVVRLSAPGIIFKGFKVQNSGDLLSSEDNGILAEKANIQIEDNTLENVLFGVYVHQSDNSTIRNNTLIGKKLDIARRGDLIRVWYSNNVLVENNRTSIGRDVVIWYSKNLILRGNRFDHARYGIHFMYCQEALVENNQFVDNSVGAYLMYSGRLVLRKNIIANNRGPSGLGIGFKDMTGAVIEENLIANNRVGFFLDGCTKTKCQKNLIAYNDIGFEVFPTAWDNLFENNNVVDNAEQVLLDHASTRTINDWQKNYWSDYRGFDANSDGIGDVPYESKKLFEKLTDHSKHLKIFFGSPAVQAVDFAASTFPIFEPTSKFEDSKPLMQPIDFALQMEIKKAPFAWGMFSMTLLFPLAGFITGFSKAGVPRSQSHARMLKDSKLILEVCHLTKFYKKNAALSDFNLTMHKGEAVALWGPNGAGKTTLIRCLLGIVNYEGVVRLMDQDVRRCGKEIRSLIGYVPQEIRLHLDQTVWETVLFYANLRRVGEARCEKLIQEWGLWESRKKMAQNLSGGMKQKLALIVALLSDPPILLLDEPTSNLDKNTRFEFEQALLNLKQSGKTLIFCSHRYREVRKIADRVIVLEAGIKKMEGSPEKLKPILSEADE